MKKYWYVVVLAVSLLLLAGCIPTEEEPEVTPDTFLTPGTFLVKAYNAGPVVEGANVVVKSGSDVLAQGVTNEDGEVTFDVANFPEKVDVEIKKYGYGISKVEGLKVADFVNNVKEVQLREAKLEPDPDEETFPEVTLTFFDANGDKLDITNVTENFTLRVDVESENHPRSVYAKIGSVPAASYLVEREFAPVTRTATFTNMDISNFYGEVPLYVEFFDYNDNMVQKIEYLKINRNITQVEGTLFVPISQTEYGYTSLYAYTRNEGVEFYRVGDLTEQISKKLESTSSTKKVPWKYEILKSSGNGIEAAPEGTNLWINMDWYDYDFASYYGLIGPDVVEPDGYKIYRSFDGKNYSHIGYSEYGFFTDYSSLLEPGKETWYAVSSYRGEEESELVEIGSVVPLDSFDVELTAPADNAKDVPAQPAFMWKPTNELKSSESEVWYNYTMWIYDLVQSDRYIFPLSLNTGNYYNFSRTGQEGVHVEFRGSEGSPEYYDLLWVWINDGYWWQYPENALEEGKTYDWGVDYAYAFSYDSDSVAYSIAIDYGYGIDPLGGVMPEKHNEFTIKTTY